MDSNGGRNFEAQNHHKKYPCVLQVNVALLCHPKEVQNHFHGLLNEMFPDLPNSTREAESLPIFKNRLKTHLFHLYLIL